METPKELFDHLKARPVETPDASYFEALAQAVIEQEKPRVIPLYKRPIVWMTAAAAAIALLVIFRPADAPVEENVLLALNEISHEDVFNYVDEHIDEFEIEMLAEAIPSENIEPVSLTTPEPVATPVETVPETTLDFDEINKDDILDYLESEGLDVYELDDTELF